MFKNNFLFAFALILNFSVNAFSYSSTLSSKQDKIKIKSLDDSTVVLISDLQPDKKYQLMSHDSKLVFTPDSQYYSKKTIDGILGLHWGMKIEVAIDELKKLGLTYWNEDSDTHFTWFSCDEKISWDKFIYDNLELACLTSNKQNNYLALISFTRTFNDNYDSEEDEEEVEELLQYIISNWEVKYGATAMKSVDKDGDTIYCIYEGEYTPSTFARAKAYVHHAFGKHFLCVNYYGYYEAMRIVDMDDFE